MKLLGVSCRKYFVRSGVGADGSGSGSCPLANIIISNAGFSMSTARKVVFRRSSLILHCAHLVGGWGRYA